MNDLTSAEWAQGKIAAVLADLSRLQATLASAETIARCFRKVPLDASFRGPAIERALLAAGIDQLTADAICTRGWRDGRPALRRAIAKLEKRLAGLRAYAEPHWTVRDHDITDPTYSFGEFAQENEVEARAFFERGRALAKVNGGAAQLKRNGVVVDAYSHLSECA